MATASGTTILGATAVAAWARTPRRVRILRFGALGVAVLSLPGPLAMGSGVPTKLALAFMHLAVAGTFVCALERKLATARASRSESTRPGSAVAPPPIVQPSDPAEHPTTEESRQWTVTQGPRPLRSVRQGDNR